MRNILKATTLENKFPLFTVENGCFVFGCRDGEQFGQFHPERHRYVGIFGNDAAVFHREQWKLVFQRSSF